MIRLIFFLLCLSGPALAGPWPRAEGEGFLAFTFDTDAETGTDNFLSFYVEYGLSRNRTFGVERRESSHQISKTVAFLRWPVDTGESQWKLAYDMGLGVVDNHGALRPGFSVGRGLDMGRLTGWFTVDTRALLLDDFDDSLLEADITFGLNATDKTKFIMQLQAGAPHIGDPYAKLAPSLVIQQTAGRHFIIGMTAGVLEVDDLKVNIGLWQEF